MMLDAFGVYLVKVGAVAGGVMLLAALVVSGDGGLSVGDTKTIFKSKTFWVNVLMGVGAVVAAGSGFNIPAQYATPVGAAVNVLLRFVSSQPVSVSGS